MAYSPNSLVEIIKSNREKKINVSRIIEGQPANIPVLSKMIADRTSNHRSTADRNELQVNRGVLESLARRMQNAHDNHKNIIELFPDIELSIQILVSSILSPKKMTDFELAYSFKKSLPLAPLAAGPILDAIKEHMHDEYELEDKLPQIVRESLFTTGSYCWAIIPEASVDETINSDLLKSYSAEAFGAKADAFVSRMTDPINLKGLAPAKAIPTSNASAKDLAAYLASSNNVYLTDNHSLLQFAKAKEYLSHTLIKQSVRHGAQVAQESVDKLGYFDIFRNRSSSSSHTNVAFVKTRDEAKRASIGAPMSVHFPSDATMPVCAQGNESEHIGYLVVLDDSGKALNPATTPDASGFLSGGDTQGAMRQQTPTQIAFRNLMANQTGGVDAEQFFLMYKDILEQQIYSSIKDSIYGKNVQIANKNDIYYLMFSRALAEQKTSVLFIPKELMTYFAFNYNEYGIGKSLLDNLTTLTSLRAILLFARVMAQSKQAIDVTRVAINLSPEDPDPEKTISQIQDSVLKLRQNFFPLGINNPIDLVNWIQRAGLQFEYSNNPLIPDVKIEFQNANIEHTVPDSDLEEELRKQTIQAIGLSPETVDAGFTPEFAVSVVNNNLLLSKRVNIYQKKLTKDLAKFLGAVTYNDESLRAKLKAVVQENLKEVISALPEELSQLHDKDEALFMETVLDLISESLCVDLPSPENTDLQNLSGEFKTYVENLDDVINATISSEIFPESVSGDISTHIDALRALFKNHLIRQWCATNSFYPEVAAICATDDEEVASLLELVSGHLTSTMRNGTKLLDMMKEYKGAANQDLQRITAGEEGSSVDSSSSDSSAKEENESGDDMLSF